VVDGTDITGRLEALYRKLGDSPTNPHEINKLVGEIEVLFKEIQSIPSKIHPDLLRMLLIAQEKVKASIEAQLISVDQELKATKKNIAAANNYKNNTI